MDPEVSKLKFEREKERIFGEGNEFAKANGWDIVGFTYPNAEIIFTHPKSGRRVGFRFNCSNWDETSPSLSLFDPETKEELPWARWPQEGWSAGDRHSVTGKPFLCLPGIHEYHIHESHLNDHWANLKGKLSYSLPHIFARVQQKFGTGNG
jgi:Predicted metal binding domain